MNDSAAEAWLLRRALTKMCEINLLVILSVEGVKTLKHVKMIRNQISVYSNATACNDNKMSACQREYKHS